MQLSGVKFYPGRFLLGRVGAYTGTHTCNRTSCTIETIISIISKHERDHLSREAFPVKAQSASRRANESVGWAVRRIKRIMSIRRLDTEDVAQLRSLQAIPTLSTGRAGARPKRARRRQRQRKRDDRLAEASELWWRIPVTVSLPSS